MTAKSMNRWMVVLGAMLVQFCIGTIYSWSLFNQPIINKFGWQNTKVVTTFSIAVFIFAFSTIFSGRLQDRIGPRKVTMIGGLLYGSGLILASRASSIVQLYIFYGIVAGAGVGFVYVCPLSTCVKWFPDKKGFITGLVVGSFGLGSLVFKPLIQFLLSSFGVTSTMLYLGIIFLVLINTGAQFLITPFTEKSFSSKKVKNVTEYNSYNVSEMIKTKSFYIMWIIYLFACISGLLIIGHATDIGIELAGLHPSVAAQAISAISIFNASGRLFWGTLSDKLGRRKVVLLMLIITSICMLVLSIVSLNFITFFVCITGIAFCFGGYLAVFPLITGDYFGLKNLGANYGIVYQAYGIAALVGPLIVAHVGGLIPTFIISSALAIIGGAMTFILKSPDVVGKNS